MQGAHFGTEKFVNQFGRIDLFTDEFLFRHSVGQLECGGQLHRFGEANTTNVLQFAGGNSRKAAQGFVLFQNLAADLDRVLARDAGPEQNRDQFTIR